MNSKKRFLTVVLSLCMMFLWLPVDVFAGNSALFVNGQNIMTAPENTIQCGDGTAVYDPDTLTLTLENAEVTTSGVQQGGVSASSMENLTIKLIGETESNGIYFSCLNISDTLTIIGDGSLSTTGDLYGIKSNGNIVIDGPKISMEVVGGNADAGIYAYANITVKDTIISSVYSNNGIFSGAGIDIINSKITATNSGDSARYGMISQTAYGDGHMTISNSKVDIVNTNSTGIYSLGVLTVEKTAEVISKARYCGLQSFEPMILEGKVNAQSDNDAAVFTPNNMTIEKDADILAVGKLRGLQSGGSMVLKGGKIHAKSTNGDAAIGARSIKNSASNPECNISLDSKYDIVGGGKLAVSDWFVSNGSTQTRSWTSFVASDSTKLLVNEAGSPTNALSEVIINQLPAITTGTLPNGNLGDEYTQKLNAIGSEPIVWSLVDGALPEGLELDKSGNGKISGVLKKIGTFTFTMKAENGVGSDTKEYTIHVEHTHVFDEWKSDNDETHTRRCSCGQVETKAHTWSGGKIVVEATEKKQGLKNYVCSDCKETKSEDIPPILIPQTNDNTSTALFSLLTLSTFGFGGFILILGKRKKYLKK